MTETPTGRASDTPALLVACVALVAVLAASALVGFVGAPHDERFSWELASIFGTALGTTLLAAATGWLAWSTRSEVRATQDLAELTRSQQVASERPIVVLMPEGGYNGSPEAGQIDVTLLNVGLGPALGVRLSATYDGHEDWQPAIGEVTVPAIAPNSSHTTRLSVTFPLPAPVGGVRGEAFQVSGVYTDRSLAKRYAVTRPEPPA